ncbi:MAG: GntR family transcriptional regulator [Clostridia bacterium]|nr:GntR family transcriptional regulator [Clostridia bacterium]
MSWKFTSELPVYVQIERHIKCDIINGVYKVEEQIPSVRQLAVEAGVNPNTVQRALAELETAGILESRRTSGRFVTQDEKILKKMKDEEAKEVIDTMIAGAKRLQLSKEEILKLVKESEGWDK